MNKYRSLAQLLQCLEPAVADGQVAVAQRWGDDEQALGLYKPGVPELAAYVSTHGQPPGYYDVDLEYPRLEDNRLGSATARCEDIGLAEVLELLAVHFDLPELGLRQKPG